MSDLDQGSALNPSRARWFWAIGIAIVAAGAIVALYFWPHSLEVPPPPVTQAPAPAQPPAQVSEPEPITHPVPQPPTAPALPLLADSDPLFTQALSGVLGTDGVRALFYPDRLIRRMVVTVDNLPRNQVAVRQLPVLPLGTAPSVLNTANGIVLAADNAQRYDRYVALVAKLDMKQAAALYRQFYPLFQQAYEELGYPNAYFNDRLVQVIDHLLATPAAPAVIALTQPKVLYEYADPTLEARSAGQKLLLRMGPKHAQTIKNQLRVLRAELVRVRTHDE